MMLRNQSAGAHVVAQERYLKPEHENYLKARAVSVELARACGLRSVTRQEGAPLVGWKGLPSDALAIPYAFLAGEANDHYRLRLDTPQKSPDGSFLRFSVAPGEGVRPYLPPGLPEALLEDTTKTRLFVESPIKAMSVLSSELLRADYLPIGLGGAQAGGHDREAKERGEYRLHPELLSRLNWEGTRAVLLLDSNRRNKRGVLRGEKLLARCLYAAGVTVLVAQLPPKDDDTDWGPDDFLAAKGPHALKAILDAARPAAEVHHPFEEIKQRLARTKNGSPLATIKNGAEILHLDPRWEGVLSYDEFSLRVVFLASPPWDEEHAPKVAQKAGDFWTDVDDIRLACWMDQHWGVRLSEKQAASVVLLVSRKNPSHPVRDWLSGLSWDGTPRIDSWLTTYFGAEDTPYTRAVGAKALISAVARVFDPGCQSKYSLILEGPQDLGKSEAIRALVGKAWFTDSLPDLKDKEAAIQIAGKWVVELAELSAMGRSAVEQTKAFLSRREDRYRAIWGRRAEDQPRQCVFIGTTNPSDYLRDETGNVRFWPVRCTKADREGLARDRDQLWAEARVRYQAGERWWLDSSELADLAREEQAARYQEDPWEDTIAEHLQEKTEVTVREILLGVLRFEEKDIHQVLQNRVVRCLRRLGWDKYPHNGGKKKIGGKVVTAYVPVAPSKDSEQRGYLEGLPAKPSDGAVENTSVAPLPTSSPLNRKVEERKEEAVEKGSGERGYQGLPGATDAIPTALSVGFTGSPPDSTKGLPATQPPPYPGLAPRLSSRWEARHLADQARREQRDKEEYGF